MSKEGFLYLQKFLGANDANVFEPLFIAQYLLVPINTIVQHYLLPWMLKDWILPDKEKSEKSRARSMKASIYLKYELLVTLINIIGKYGRNAEYDFSTDEHLDKVLNGKYGLRTKLIKPYLFCLWTVL